MQRFMQQYLAMNVFQFQSGTCGFRRFIHSYIIKYTLYFIVSQFSTFGTGIAVSADLLPRFFVAYLLLIIIRVYSFFL